MNRMTHSHTVFTAGGPDMGGPPPAPAPSAATTTTTRVRVQLRHPGAQHEVRGQGPKPEHQQAEALDPQAQRVVEALLQELETTRRQGAAAQSELAAVKDELLLTLRQQRRRSGGGEAAALDGRSGKEAAAAGSGAAGAGRKQHAAPPGAAPTCGTSAPAAVTSTHIRAFRPAGKAPPPRTLPQQAAHKDRPQPAAEPASATTAAATAAGRQPAGSGSTQAAAGPQQQEQEGQVQQVEALRQDNSEMRAHLEALYAHCRNLQRQLDMAGPASRALSPRRPLRPAVEVTAAVLGSPQRPRSPGRTTVVVSSPRAGHGGPPDLTVALFEPPPEDVEGLRLALNRQQRQNLKLSSKLSKAKEELVTKSIEARRWQEKVEQQAVVVHELRVDLEMERGRQRLLEQALAAAEGERDAAQQGADALLEQLQATQAAANAAEGELASVRGQLAVAHEQAERALHEAERLAEESTRTNARLAATDLVRREAERERDDLQLQVQRLQAALEESKSSRSSAEEELARLLSAAQQHAAAEKQRNSMLQAQLSLAEAQGRETERILTEQLRSVQEERNACLAAATRADALLVKLGQHAMATRGADC